MFINRLLQLIPLICLLSLPAMADEAAIKKVVRTQMGAEPQSVSKTAYAGLYEVVLGDKVFYSDEKGDYFFIGGVYDTKTQSNITAERLQKIMAVQFDALLLDSAIKIVKGNGRRKLAVFSDADCPYCKKLEQDLVKVTDVTIYILLYPIDSLHPQAAEKSKSIWCAPDRAKAWNEWMMKGNLPKNKGTCETPIAKLVELGQKLHVSGTPTLFFADGRRVPGAISAEQIEKYLNSAESK
jgi:thiol:disulfide interchange protein DsbC